MPSILFSISKSRLQRKETFHFCNTYLGVLIIWALAKTVPLDLQEQQKHWEQMSDTAVDSDLSIAIVKIGIVDLNHLLESVKFFQRKLIWAFWKAWKHPIR